MNPATNSLLSKLAKSFSVIFLLASSLAAQTGQKSLINRVLEEEQKRTFAILSKQGNQLPYYLGYLVTDVQSTAISASLGALRSNDTNRYRNLDVSLRVGTMKLDNTNGSGGRTNSARLPIENDADALKNVIWSATDEAYKNAVDSLVRIQTEKQTSVADENPADNFSPAVPQVSFLPEVSLTVDRSSWAERLKKFSAVFKKYPQIYSSSVVLSADSINRYFVNSEGSSVQHGKTLMRISIFASTRANDGMDLVKYDAIDAATPSGMPDDARIMQAVEKVARDLMALRQAPVVEPFVGPAILSGRASGVFFHEIFGHRIEGHRQKDKFDGNTFTKRVNQNILPNFISVVDDPTQSKLAALDLNGHYYFDEEGVKSQKVTLVENGVLKNFLMSRSPIAGFPVSNGHGRASPGLAPVSRQGNLIVQTAKTVSKERLRQLLLEEIKRQNTQYGLFFEDISGGFTTTSRNSPQAFQVMPIVVYKIYADGRPDELVRGVDLIGTPLTSFSKIIATDNQPEVFNGFCGAESGFVPVSAISPSILIGQIEVQKRAKGFQLLPILPPPTLTR